MNNRYTPYDEDVVDGEIIAYVDDDNRIIDYDELDRQAHSQLDPIEERAIARGLPLWIARIEQPLVRGMLAVIYRTLKTSVKQIGNTLWTILKELNASVPYPYLLGVYAMIALVLIVLPLAAMTMLVAPDPAPEAVQPQVTAAPTVAVVQDIPVLQAAPTQAPPAAPAVPDIKQQLRDFARENPLSAALPDTFTPTVRVWGDELLRWSAAYGVDVNLLATAMQVTTCGNPSYLSGDRAGLFAVPLADFADGEAFTNPDVNARRAAERLRQGLVLGNGDAGFALAYAVGGLQVLESDFSRWSQPMREAFIHGRNLYEAAQRGDTGSGALDGWLFSGGAALCQPALLASGG